MHSTMRLSSRAEQARNDDVNKLTNKDRTNVQYVMERKWLSDLPIIRAADFVLRIYPMLYHVSPNSVSTRK